LLDLFHTGIPWSEDATEMTGPLMRIDGQVNINTATRETLRALAAGRLVQDPQLKRNGTDAPPPPSTPVVLFPPRSSGSAAHADLVADRIIAARPFLSPSEIPEKVVDQAGKPLLGTSTINETNPSVRTISPEWNDAAAEEVFARIFNNSTVRSRNFRITVTGQTVIRTRTGSLRVLATRSKVFNIFIRPVRQADGTITSQHTEIIHVRSL
jgi:hypothetical protein